MPDLIDEAPPRSPDTVAAWSAPATRRISRLARNVSLWILAIPIVVCVIVIVLEATSGAEDALREAVTAVLSTLFFAGLLPVIAIRHFILRDANAVEDLVRNGAAYRARVTSHERMALGGMHLVQVEWVEDGHASTARLDIEKLDKDLGVGSKLTVLARRDSRSVGAIVDGTLHVGLRPRFPRGRR